MASSTLKVPRQAAEETHQNLVLENQCFPLAPSWSMSTRRPHMVAILVCFSLGDNLIPQQAASGYYNFH